MNENFFAASVAASSKPFPAGVSTTTLVTAPVPSTSSSSWTSPDSPFSNAAGGYGASMNSLRAGGLVIFGSGTGVWDPGAGGCGAGASFFASGWACRVSGTQRRATKMAARVGITLCAGHPGRT